MSLNKIGQADEAIMDLCSQMDSDLLCEVRWGFPGSSAGKESFCKAGDPDLILESRRSPGEGIGHPLQYSWASLVAQVVIRLQRGKPGFDPWVRKIPWRRARQPTLIFLPGESQGQRSLAGYSPWSHKESDTTEQLSTARCRGEMTIICWLEREMALVC